MSEHCEFKVFVKKVKMALAKYAFNARYIGRQSVRGPFSDSGLSEVVSELRSKSLTQPPSGSGLKSSSVHEEIRCNLEFCDKSLLVRLFYRNKPSHGLNG